MLITNCYNFNEVSMCTEFCTHRQLIYVRNNSKHRLYVRENEYSIPEGQTSYIFVWVQNFVRISSSNKKLLCPNQCNTVY